MTSKRPCLGRDVLQRRVAPLGLLVDQHGVALREGAALAVLARQAHRKALVEQRGERQVLGHRPIDAGAVSHHLTAALQQALDGLVRVEVLRDRGDAPAHLLQRIDGNAGLAAAGLVVGKADVGPAAVEPVGLVGLVAVGGRQLLVEMRAELGLHAVDFLRADDAFLDQPLGVDLDRVGCALMARYISGCVKAGSSDSLWPCRR